MKFNINEEQLKGIGKVGLRIGKSIIVEGTKAVILKGAVATINAGFENGLDGIKSVSLDDVLKDKKDKAPKEKKGFFNRKKRSKSEDIKVDIVEDSEGNIVGIFPEGKLDECVQEMSKED